jgi:hypothetical protein
MDPATHAKLIVQFLTPVAASAASLRPGPGSTAADLEVYWTDLINEAASVAKLFNRKAPGLLEAATTPPKEVK